MANIQYDPERILNGFTIEVLKELIKRLKRKIRPTKSEIIQEILSHPRGKPEERVKVWQEINRYLRKELESFSQEAFTLVSSGDVPREERFKVGYMFTLSSDSEIRALGEELYCRQAEEDKALDNDIEEEEEEEEESLDKAILLFVYLTHNEKVSIPLNYFFIYPFSSLYNIPI